MEGYMGEIKMFAGNYPPANWLYCQGQLLAINQYSALFALLGTTYGGDGVNNFQLPDLRGRVPVGSGNGTGLTPRTQGQYSGYERVTITTNNLPSHNHTVNCDNTSSGRDVSDNPANMLPGKTTGNSYGSGGTGSPLMKTNMINQTGANQPVENMQPWLCLNYIICVVGIWPPRS